MESKTFLDLDNADYLSILDKWQQMNEFLEVFRVQSTRIGLKTDFKKTKSLRLEIKEDEEVSLDNQKIDRVDSLT